MVDLDRLISSDTPFTEFCIQVQSECNQKSKVRRYINSYKLKQRMLELLDKHYFLGTFQLTDFINVVSGYTDKISTPQTKVEISIEDNQYTVIIISRKTLYVRLSIQLPDRHINISVSSNISETEPNTLIRILELRETNLLENSVIGLLVELMKRFVKVYTDEQRKK